LLYQKEEEDERRRKKQKTQNKNRPLLDRFYGLVSKAQERFVPSWLCTTDSALFFFHFCGRLGISQRAEKRGLFKNEIK
jgi:hypothetical protein